MGADFIDFPTLVKDNKRSAANNNNEVFIHTFPLSLPAQKEWSHLYNNNFSSGMYAVFICRWLLHTDRVVRRSRFISFFSVENN